ncbi:MAG: hypothetical protein ACFBSG_20435 [Leptolyngbyaceae cyanobacterium]
MSHATPKDICQVGCFNIELVNHIQNWLPSNDLLETDQILFSALGDR